MQRWFFAGSFPHLLYKIIPVALAEIFRVGNMDGLVSGCLESWWMCLVHSSAFLHLRSLFAWQAEQQGQTAPGFSPHGHRESEVL